MLIDSSIWIWFEKWRERRAIYLLHPHVRGPVFGSGTKIKNLKTQRLKRNGSQNVSKSIPGARKSQQKTQNHNGSGR